MIKDIKRAREVQKLRAKGLSFRAIAKLLDRHVKTVWRWSKFDISEKV